MMTLFYFRNYSLL